MIPKNLMSVASQGLQNKGGLIAPPPWYLEVSLQAGRDRVKVLFFTHSEGQKYHICGLPEPSKRGGPNRPPPRYLEVSLTAGRDRVNCNDYLLYQKEQA